MIGGVERNMNHTNIYAQGIRRSEHDDHELEIVAEEKPIMILRVEDKLGVIHILKFYMHDDPRTVAQNFGLSNGLDQQAIGNLTKNIQASLNRLEEKRSEYGSAAAVEGFEERAPRTSNLHPPGSQNAKFGSGSKQQNSTHRGGQKAVAKSFQSPSNLKGKHSQSEKQLQLDTDPINLGEKTYIVGKGKQQVEM